jgi:hypothetical protein
MNHIKKRKELRMYKKYLTDDKDRYDWLENHPDPF